jgi:hypothetical protein
MGITKKWLEKCIKEGSLELTYKHLGIYKGRETMYIYLEFEGEVIASKELIL